MPKVKIKPKPNSNGNSKSLSAQKDASERVIINRMLNKKLPFDNKTPLEILKNVSWKSGVNMPFLAGNAFQEGMNKMVEDYGGKTTEQVFDEDEFSELDDQFPVNGFKYYGLDTFGTIAPELIKKGYLNKDFQYRESTGTNEKKGSVLSAKFKTNEDALTAKAAFIRHVQDGVREYAAKKNIKLEPKTMDYLTMTGYNGGLGNAKLMMDELATGRFNQKDYVDQGLTSRKGVHKNIPPRFNKIGIIDKLTSGPVAPFKGTTIPEFPNFKGILNNQQ